MRFSIISIGILFSSLSLANVNLSDSNQLNKNILECVGEGSGSSFKRGCGVNGTLSYATPLEVSLSVSYSFPGCESSSEGFLKMGISNESSEKSYFSFPSGGTLNLTTSGALNFFNETRGQRTKKVKKGCELRITSVKQTPSPTTQALINEFESLVASVNSEIEQRRKDLIGTYNLFVSLSFTNQRLFCLIYSYDDPIFDDNEVLIDLKEQFTSISGTSYAEALEQNLYSCETEEETDFRALINEIEQECSVDIRFSAGCPTLRVYKQNEQWFVEKINQINASKYRILDQLNYREVREETVATLESILAEDFSDL